MNLKSKIAIIGAGPAGLSTAKALKEKGYTNVVIFEKCGHVGGQALSCEYEAENGQTIHYDMGAWQPLGSKRLLKTIQAHGLKLKPKIPIHIYSLEHQQCLYELDTYIRSPSWSKIRDGFVLLKAILPYASLWKAGLAETKHDKTLSMPWLDFLDRLFLDHDDLIKALTITPISFGYYDEIQHISTLKGIYSLYTMLHPPHHYLFGYYSTLEKGYQSLWIEVAKDLDVRLNHPVKKIERFEEKVIIHTDEPYECDHVILAMTQGMADILDVSPQEEKLISAIHTMPGWRAAFICDTLPFNALLIDVDCVFHDIASMSIMPFGEVSPGKTLYSVGYGYEHVEDPEVIKTHIEKKLKEAFNTSIDQFLNVMLWKQYAPQYYPEEVAQGYYHQLEALQGERRTYYACEILHGSSNGRAMDYAYKLVKRFF